MKKMALICQLLFFLRDEHLKELGLLLGEKIRLNQVLEHMRKVEVIRQASSGVIRNTKFIKGDLVEHLRVDLIRRGKVVGVHAHDNVGIYYTVEISKDFELQSEEKNLEAPGVWEKFLREKDIIPVYQEAEKEDTTQNAQPEVFEQETSDTGDDSLKNVEAEAEQHPLEDSVPMEEAPLEDVETHEPVAESIEEVAPIEDLSYSHDNLEEAHDHAYTDAHPVFVGMSRYSTRFEEPIVLESEPLKADEGENAFAPPLPVSRRLGSRTVSGLDDETSGMRAPPPPIPRQSESPIDEELETYHTDDALGTIELQPIEEMMPEHHDELDETNLHAETGTEYPIESSHDVLVEHPVEEVYDIQLEHSAEIESEHDEKELFEHAVEEHHDIHEETLLEESTEQEFDENHKELTTEHLKEVPVEESHETVHEHHKG